MASTFSILMGFNNFMWADIKRGDSLFVSTGSKIVDGRSIETFEFSPDFLARYAEAYDQLSIIEDEKLAELSATDFPKDVVEAARLLIGTLVTGELSKYSEGQLRQMEIQQLMNPFADPGLTPQIEMMESVHADVTRELLIQKYFGSDVGSTMSDKEFMIAYHRFNAHLDNLGKLNNLVHHACRHDAGYQDYLKYQGVRANIRERRQTARRMKKLARVASAAGNKEEAKEIRGIIKREIISPDRKLVRRLRQGKRYINSMKREKQIKNIKTFVGSIPSKVASPIFAFAARHWDSLMNKKNAFFNKRQAKMAKLLANNPIPDIFISSSIETLSKVLDELKKNPPQKIVDDVHPIHAEPEPKPTPVGSIGSNGYVIKNGEEYSLIPYTVENDNIVVTGEPVPIDKSQLSIEQLNQAELGIANIEVKVIEPGKGKTTQKVPYIIDPEMLGVDGVPIMLHGDNLYSYNYARLTGMPRPKDKTYIKAASEAAHLVTISGTAEQKEYEIVRRREFARMLTYYEMGKNESLNDEVNQLVASREEEFNEFKNSPDRVFEDEATARFAFYYHIENSKRITAKPAVGKHEWTRDKIAIVSCDEDGKNAKYVHYLIDENGSFIISEVFDARERGRTRGIKNLTPEEISEVRQSMSDGVITIHRDGESFSFVSGIDENGHMTYQPYEEFKQTSTYLATVVLPDEFESFREDGATLVDASRDFMGTGAAADYDMDRIERRKQIVDSYMEFINDEYQIEEARQFMENNARWYEEDKYKDMPEEVRLFRFKWDREHSSVLDVDEMSDDHDPEHDSEPVKKPIPRGIEDLAADALWLDMYKTIGQMKEPNSELPMIGTVVSDILRVASKQDAQMDPEKRKARMQEILVDTYTNHAMKELIENFHLIKDGKETEIMAELTKYGIDLGELGIDFSKFNRRQCETIARALANKKYQAILDLGMEEVGMARVTLVELSKGKYNNAQGIDWANVQIRESEDGSLRIDGRRDSKFYRALVQSGIEFNREKYEAAIRDEITANIDLQNEAISPDANIVTLQLEDESEIQVVQIDKDGVTVYITQENPPKIIEAEEISPDNTLIDINEVVQVAANGREKIDLEQRKINARVSESEENAIKKEYSLTI